MDYEHHLSNREELQDRPKSIEKSQRFSYLLEDPKTVVERWKGFSDLMDQTDATNPLLESLETVCLVLGRELVELTQFHPRHAAELVAEILHREDVAFSRFAHSEAAILYLAGQNESLALQLWEMFVEFYPTEIGESAQHMRSELRAMTVGQEEAPVIEAPHADRVAMAMFYMDHVSQYDTL